MNELNANVDGKPSLSLMGRDSNSVMFSKIQFRLPKLFPSWDDIVYCSFPLGMILTTRDEFSDDFPVVRQSHRVGDTEAYWF